MRSERKAATSFACIDCDVKLAALGTAKKNKNEKRVNVTKLEKHISKVLDLKNDYWQHM